MNKYIFIITICCLVMNVQAQFYKCKQETGEYLFSDKPCVINNKYSNTVVDLQGNIVYLATTSKPNSLPNGLVDELLLNVEKACRTKNEESLLAYVSEKVKKEINREKLHDRTAIQVLARVCNNVYNIKTELLKITEPVFFASKVSGKESELCFYTATKGLNRCMGAIKIAAEQNKLKLNSR